MKSCRPLCVFQAELSLLTLGEEEKGHFNYTDLVENGKQGGKKGKKKAKKGQAVGLQQDGFQVWHFSKFKIAIIMCSSSDIFFMLFTWMFICSLLLFSSPEHKVLRVSYCDRPLSVVRRRASSVVRRP